jgi:hypothetical protein
MTLKWCLELTPQNFKGIYLTNALFANETKQISLFFPPFGAKPMPF